MTISAASRSACFAAFARRSARSTLPSRSQPTTTTRSPAIAALAGLVPCARGRDQADIAMRLAARLVTGADRQQAGIFALRSGIRLQRHRGKAGRPPSASPPAARISVGIALRSGRPARTDGCRRSPGSVIGDHLRRRVQLHRAGPERDHAAVERDVLVLQPLQIAQHLVLGVVLAEHRLLQERRAARSSPAECAARRAAKLAAQQRRPAAPGRRASPSRPARCRRRVVVDAPQVEARPQRAPASAHRHRRIRPRSCRRTRRAAADARPRAPHPPAAAPADSPAGRCAAAPPARATPRRTRRSPPAAPARCRCWRSPSRAGCAARASAAPAASPAAPAASTDTPTSRPGMCRLNASRVAKNAGMRAAETHRHAEALRRARPRHRRPSRPAASAAPAPADRPRRSPARPPSCAAAISGDRSRTAPVVPGYCSTSANGCAAPIAATSPGATSTSAMPSGFARVASTARVCGCTIGRHREHVGFRLADGVRHRHRLGRRGRLIQQRGVGDLHAGQLADHRLEIQQRFQPALRDLRLVRRVGGVPAGIFQHVAQDHRRRDACRDSPCRSATSSARSAPPARAARRSRAASSIGGGRSSAWLVRIAAGTVLRGQVVQGRGADRVQHRGDVGLRRADMARDETVRRLERRPARRAASMSQRLQEFVVGVLIHQRLERVGVVDSSRKNQPSPSASLFTSAGSSTIVSLISTTLPASGA